MDEYLIALRIVHILAAIFWVGAAAVFALFIEPTAVALGPAGGPFMAHLSTKKKLPEVIAVAAAVTIIAGTLLYWRVSSGFDPDWITSDTGLGFTVGAVAAITSFVVGFTVLRPGIQRMGTLGQAHAAGDQAAAAEMQRLGHRLTVVGRVNLTFLVVAALAMATARYL